MQRRSGSLPQRLIPVMLAMLPLAVADRAAAAGTNATAQLVEDCPAPIRLDSPERLRGPVNTLEATIADSREGRLVQRSIASRARYTEAGVMAEEDLIRDGVITRRAVYFYSSATQVLSRVDEYGRDQHLDGIHLFHYDPSKQRITSSYQRPPGTQLSHQIFTVGIVGSSNNKSGIDGAEANRRIITRSILTAAGKPILESRFQFTAAGNLASVVTTRGSLREARTCSYDSAGRLIRIASRQDGPDQPVILGEEHYSYRPGEVEGRLCQGGGSSCIRLVLQGQPGKPQTLSVWTRAGALEQRWSYGSQGELIGIDSYDIPLIGSQRLRIHYTYDPQGNWIEKQTFCGPVGTPDQALKLCETESRRITYHPNPPASVPLSPPQWANGILLLGRPLVLPLAPIP